MHTLQFTPEANTERNINIGLHLPKLYMTREGLHGCFILTHSV